MPGQCTGKLSEVGVLILKIWGHPHLGLRSRLFSIMCCLCGLIMQLHKQILAKSSSLCLSCSSLNIEGFGPTPTLNFIVGALTIYAAHVNIQTHTD